MALFFLQFHSQKISDLYCFSELSTVSTLLDSTITPGGYMNKFLNSRLGVILCYAGCGVAMYFGILAGLPA